MQKEDEFDLALREKFQDAEVKAPSGVWKAVSSRLDDIEGVSARQSEPSRGWYWLAGSLAAAALAMALVLTGIFSRQQPEQQLARVEQAPSVLVDTEDAVVFEDTQEAAPVTIARLSSPDVVRNQIAVEAPVEKAAAVEPSQVEKVVAEQAPAAAEAAVRSLPAAAESPAEQKLPSIRDAGFVAPEIEKKNDAGFGSYVSGTVSGNGSTNRQTSYSSGSSSLASSDYILETGSSVYGVPFSVGAGVRYHFNQKLSLSAGLDYSLLTRTFAGTYLPEGASAPVQGDAHHYVHYLGIPVNVYYNFLETSLLSFYGFLGGEIEFCLASKYRFTSANNDYYLSETVKNPLFSVRMGVGIEFKVSKLVGIYLDPGAYYCFYSQQPKSLRTDRPFNFNLNAGVRFNL